MVGGLEKGWSLQAGREAPVRVPGGCEALLASIVCSGHCKGRVRIQSGLFTSIPRCEIPVLFQGREWRLRGLGNLSWVLSRWGWNQGFTCGLSSPSRVPVPPAPVGAALVPGGERLRFPSAPWQPCLRQLLCWQVDEGAASCSLRPGAGPWREWPGPGRLCQALQHKCRHAAERAESAAPSPRLWVQVVAAPAWCRPQPEAQLQVCPGSGPSLPPSCPQWPGQAPSLQMHPRWGPVARSTGHQLVQSCERGCGGRGCLSPIFQDLGGFVSKVSV